MQVGVFLAILALGIPAWAFKAEEFKKCSDAGFCARNRLAPGPPFEVVPDSVTVGPGGKALKALARNTRDNVAFDLELSLYNGIVRFQLDEKEYKGRYRVPDVLLPDLDSRAASLESRVARAADHVSVSFPESDTVVRLSYSPLVLEVSVGGVQALVLGAEGMLSVEHKRAAKSEGEPDSMWEETFRGHKDTKPKGPQAISFDLSMTGMDNVYGLPERATSFSLRPTYDFGSRRPLTEPYRLYNADVFEYEHDHPFGLYGSIPLLVGINRQISVGAFWLNAAEMYVDIGRHGSTTISQWTAESGVLDLFLLVGPTPADVSRQYASLTGGTAMPQLFSLGYHQCRWNYRDQHDVAQVDAGFDEHGIPYDVLWLDIEHTDGKRYLTWDKALFPEPAKMQNDLASRGRKMVTIVDPHVKRDSNYRIFSEAESRGLFVKNREGKDLDGWCWPGSSSYLDMTSPVARSWWADQFLPEGYPGSTGSLYIWNDMNEPSVFNGPEITMDKDAIHAGGWEHRDVHNLYGFYYHSATAEGLRRRGLRLAGPDGDRPFVLSRAFFAGTQRVGPIWTGDNRADWNHLRASIPMVLTLGITGLPFSGADVGGFFGNPEPELLVRWYQLGAFYPFFRAHAHLETKRREPWLFDSETTRRIRDAVIVRYSLLPYIYSLFREANETGDPILRPTFYEFPRASDTFTLQDQALLGPSLMIRPVMEPHAIAVNVVLPSEACWYWYNSGKPVQWPQGGSAPGLRAPVNLDSIPIFLRGGGIVPRRDRVRRSTAQSLYDPIKLIVALDKSGSAANKEGFGWGARGNLYLDDGRSYAYERRGDFIHRTIEFTSQGVMRSTARRVSSPSHELAGIEVDRIVVLGLAKESGWGGKAAPWADYEVVESGTGRVLEGAFEAMPSPSGANGDGGAWAFVVRSPGLHVGADWTLQFKERKA